MIVGETASPGRLAAGRLVPWAALLIAGAAALLGHFTIHAFNQAIGPELDNRSRLIGTVVRASIQRALDLGIPLNELRGTEKYLTNVLESFPEVARLAIRAPDGTIVSSAEHGAAGFATYDLTLEEDQEGRPAEFASDAFVFPILTRNKVVGDIVIQTDRAFVNKQFRDVFLDVLVVVLVAVLAAFEIMLAVVTISMSKPLDRLQILLGRQASGDFSRRLARSVATSLDRVTARFSDHSEDLNARFAQLVAKLPDPPSASSMHERLTETGRRLGLAGHGPEPIRLTDVADMRLPLFLFVVAEELSKPFLPLYIRAAATGESPLGEAVIISMPLIAYLVALVVLSSVAGVVTARYPVRRIFLAGLAPVALSHVGLSVSDSVAEIVLWRGLAGAGYAVATIACQDYALRASAGSGRARGIGGFIAVVIGGTFCGTAVGGVLADRIGQSNVFLAGAALVGIAALLAMPMLAAEQTARARQSPAMTRGPGMWSAFANMRFVALLLGIAIPANILVAAFLWYLVPLMLTEAGSAPADIGRALMLYYLAVVLLAPRVAVLAERTLDPRTMVAAGGIVSGLALVAATHWHGYPVVAAAIAIAGVGHAMIRAPQVEVALQIAEADARGLTPSATLGALRTFERVGSIVGLAFTAVVAGEIGYVSTTAFTGYCVVAGATVFAGLHLLDRLSRRGKT